MVEIRRNIDDAIVVMQDAGKWLVESGKVVNKWWKLKNLNKEFLLQFAKPEEFYVLYVDDVPAAASILQVSQNSQDWKVVDEDNPQESLYIHWFCVARDFKGKELPKVFIAHAKEIARKKSVGFLRVDTNADEPKLIAMYEKLGFTSVKIIKEDYRNTVLYQMRV